MEHRLFGLFVGCLDSESESFAWVIWIPREDQFQRDSISMTDDEYTHQQFQMFQQFHIAQIHLPPPHLLWPRSVTPQVVLLHFLFPRGL